MNFEYPNLMLMVALVVTPLLLLVFQSIALKYGLVDVPNSRKIHEKPIALVGGLVLFIMAAGLLMMTENVNNFESCLLLGSGFVVFIGLLDDLFGLSALWRFVVQIVASLLIIYFAKVQLYTFGFLIFPNWDLQLGFLSIPVTVFGVVGIINALNMADGIDGLAAMTFIAPTLALIFLAGPSDVSIWLLMFVVCIFVFVAFNKSTAFKVFLGDAGSLLLGFILAWLLVYFSQGQFATIKPVTALYLVGLPIIDTIFVMTKRMISGVSPFNPDKTHLHHLFLAQGFSQTRTLIVMVFFQLFFISLGVLFLEFKFDEYLQFYLFVLISGFYYVVLHKLWAKHDCV